MAASWGRAFIVLATCFLVTPASAAADLTIDDFVGSYSGTGLAKSREAALLQLDKRDMDVAIRKQGEGFSVRWITVVHQGRGDDENPAVKRAETTVSFVPTGSASFFRSRERNDPAGPLGYAWARLKERTLSVYLLVVDPRDGSYDLHGYHRTLDTDGNTMHLKFSRIRSGRPQVVVEGDLKRNK